METPIMMYLSFLATMSRRVPRPVGASAFYWLAESSSLMLKALVIILQAEVKRLQ